jgi:hypothetical protein
LSGQAVLPSLVDVQLLDDGCDATLKLKFTDNKEDTVDITNMHAGQVFKFIKSRIQEKGMAEVLTTHGFLGKKLDTKWGL